MATKKTTGKAPAKVLEAYEQKLAEIEGEDEALDAGENLDEQAEEAPNLGQSM